ncbi:MAG: Triphosphoribosyl-dephospho-CoA synthetase [Candidatus Syntrophoarchaeum caldarius]|uniref:Triphosphoribosyl-dephospho-CoA synthetase n=1 Tax=Candidatus Syntropharchaeum caldarium TaxID=1838285 RepID=A0A1F2PAJ8_9EURY|nr:MAG: Triphosphoribosyl-dephospho-CoA synthetase [Candidatus Syntrophoarchaeum caldarius]
MRKKPESDPDLIAQAAQLAMLLEVSASPKAGNVDRCHDYPDTRYEDFLASSVAVYPVFRKAALKDTGVGKLIFEAVEASKRWHTGGNTHFGAFILLIPLVMAGGVQDLAKEIVRGTGWQDAIDFYRAFAIAGVRVGKVNDLNLGSQESLDRIREEKITLFDIFKISSSYDSVSAEWINGFERSFKYAWIVGTNVREYGMNDGIVLTFMQLLAEYPDTFIAMKSGNETALDISATASKLACEFDLDKIRSFDEELIERGINPGATADMIIASIFIALIKGWL